MVQTTSTARHRESRLSPILTLDPITFDLPEGDTLVGSGAHATWRVQGRDLMARHFVVRAQNGTAIILPASSDSVLAVEGYQVDDNGTVLLDGCRITAGTASFMYWQTAARPGVSAEPRPVPPAHLIDDRWGLAYPLTRTSTAIGRDPSNVIVLRDPTASRFHAEIRREAGGYALHSMGSTGTQLNGEAFTAPRLLREGDRIEIAFSGLRFTEQALPPQVSVRTEGAVVDPEVASKDTQQREHVSLEQPKLGSEPPRNMSLLLGTAAAILALVAGLFYLAR